MMDCFIRGTELVCKIPEKVSEKVSNPDTTIPVIGWLVVGIVLIVWVHSLFNLIEWYVPADGGVFVVTSVIIFLFVKSGILNIKQVLRRFGVG